ncbi:hypothetical protein JCM4814A_82760 [Streptomyces phaeofaciens JCM 4814]|uniref:Uncharacterized protein n=1 Tax=Streptomyces phaeofaciens TaxID=68254 RepID=A0A918M101_9ACTN|nr:hypothetical protein [Streptomyces phaeofaciens]GGT90412.1 hypothetical protein GCM10010226_80760 [Streptomyces phaeofaciens]
MPEDLQFAPYLQSPVGGAIRGTVPNGPALLDPGLTLVGPGGEIPVRPPGDALRMLGPEGVIGIDTGHVLRVDPPPGILDAEPNYLACVEFDAPELPWLFTPARPADGMLRPWLVLVAVETSGHPLQGGGPLPFVDVDAAALPPLDQSWQWAHVQRPAGRPGPLISRLLCPLRLRSDTDYTACVVPAFQGGVAAGLSGGLTEVDQHGDAWRRDQGGVRLPVYYSWQFRTGAAGDFEQLAAAIVPLSAEERGPLSGRTVDISEPWLHGPPLASADPPGTRQTITVQGVLQLVDSPAEQAVTALADFASRVALHISRGTEDAVAPPLYGGRPVVRDDVEDGESGWLAELNLNPETRIAASLGAGWVRENQEWLMARAWDQVGDVREANRLRGRNAFCTAVADSVYRRSVQTLSPDETLGFAAPVGDRVRTGSELPLRTEVVVSPAPNGLVAPALRRLLRRRGPVARRAGLDGESYVRRTLSGELLPPLPTAMVTRPVEAGQLAGEDTVELNAKVGTALRATATTRGARTLRLLSAMAPSAWANGFDSQAGALTALVARPAEGGAPAEGTTGPADALRMFQALSALELSDLTGDLSPAFAEQPPDAVMTVAEPDTALSPDASMADDPGAHILQFGVPVDAPGLRERLAQAFDPAPLLAARLDSTVTILSEEALAVPASPGDPVMTAPDFPAPMALALKDTARDWFLPGSGTIPDDRAVLLQANAPFIASFMVGLNDEMNGEMRWREYPTDLRGSPFTHFWPRPDGEPDVPPVHGWDPDGTLSAQLTLGAGELDVLLIRGRLVRRYSQMIVAAVPAQSVGAADLGQDTWEHPKMVLTLDERTCAYAFVLPGDIHDWWFVLAENSYRMRFGFDNPVDPAPPYRHWSDLSWQVPEGGFADLSAMPAVPEQEPRPDRWNAATVAMVSLQRPFRVVMSARKLIGDPS